MLRSENVATPRIVWTVTVPDRIAPTPPEPGVIATVTSCTKLVSVTPDGSCAVTVTGGSMALPASVLPGGVLNTTLAAGTATLKSTAPSALPPPDTHCPTAPPPSTARTRQW